MSIVLALISWTLLFTVVREGANLLHHESATSDGLGTSTGTVVGVLPQKARILFVDADRVLDNHG